MSRVLTASWVVSVLASGCLAGAVEESGSEDTERGDTAALPGPDLVDPAELFYCGNGYCDPGERAWTCPKDCDGASHGELTLEVSPRLYHQGVEVQPKQACASEERSGWHRPAVGTSVPYSAFITSCPVHALDAGLPDFYEGYSARWLFTIEEPGSYSVAAWISAAERVCAVEGLTGGGHYFMFGPAHWRAYALISQRAESAERWVTVFDRVYLPIGSYEVVLPDSAVGGCSCGAEVPCATGLQRRRVAAGNILVTSR